MAKHLVVIS